MVTKEEARDLALAHVKSFEAEAGLELVLLDGITMEENFGWVFFYDSKRCVQTGNPLDRLAGNAPIVVTRADGALHETGTALPLEHYLRRFR